MTIAFRAPDPNYKPVRYVTMHAVERMRERFKQEGNISYLTDRQIISWLDLAVNAAGKPEEFEDDGEVTWVVKIEGDLYALIKDATSHAKRKGFHEAVVTLLRPDAYYEYKNNGRWKSAVPFNSMAEQLRAVESARPINPDALPGDDAEKQHVTTLERVAQSDPVRESKPLTVLITWNEDDTDCGGGYREEWAIDKATERVAELAELPHVESIRVWREVEFEVKREVRVDFKFGMDDRSKSTKRGDSPVDRTALRCIKSGCAELVDIRGVYCSPHSGGGAA